MRRQSSLEFDDLRTIIALAEELNFHRAGRRVGLSQPGVTRVLAKVERHVGACLFERSHSKRNSVVLNDAGRSYVERARLALAHGDGAVLAARETMHGIDRLLVVGRSPHVDRRLVEILHSIELPLYPNLRVDLPTRYAGELPACIRSGEFDLAIITNPPEDPFLTSTLLRCTPFTVVLPEGHGCARSQFTSLEHLKSTPWIFFERHVHPALYDAFRDRARGLGIGQERIHHVADAEEACEMVRRMVELFWGVLSIGDAQLRYVFRWQAAAMGQTQIPDTGTARAGQCAMAHQDEERFSSDVFLLERYQIFGWIMGAV